MQQTFSGIVNAPVSTGFFIAIPLSHCKFAFEKIKSIHELSLGRILFPWNIPT